MFLRDNKLEWNLQLILLVKVWHLVRELEKNQDKRPEEWKSFLNNLQDAWDTLSSGGDAPLQEAEEGTVDQVNSLD